MLLWSELISYDLSVVPVECCADLVCTWRKEYAYYAFIDCWLYTVLQVLVQYTAIVSPSIFWLRMRYEVWGMSQYSLLKQWFWQENWPKYNATNYTATTRSKKCVIHTSYLMAVRESGVMTSNVLHITSEHKMLVIYYREYSAKNNFY